MADDEVSDDLNDWVDGARPGVIKLVAVDITDSVEYDNKGSLDVEVERGFD